MSRPRLRLEATRPHLPRPRPTKRGLKALRDQDQGSRTTL